MLLPFALLPIKLGKEKQIGVPREKSISPSVALCADSVGLCVTINYTELHRDFTEVHREKKAPFILFCQ